GSPVIPYEIHCPLCMQTFDQLGDHAACCEKTGDNTTRHNRVRDLFARFCTEGLLSPVVELRNIFQKSDHRPGDVTLPNWTGGRPLAVDVAVTSPFSAFGMRSENPADSYSHVYKHGKFQRPFRGKWCLFSALVIES